jgi:hypothetical protein
VGQETVSLAESTPKPDGATRLRTLLSDAQLVRVTKKIGMTVPWFRAGHAHITKKPGTWPLRMWAGERLAPVQPAWLTNPDPRCTFAELVAETMDDAVWEDRAYWGVTRRSRDTGYPLAFRRIPAADVTEDERGIRYRGQDPVKALDLAAPVILTDGRILESVIPMHWCGLGGLQGAGRVVMDLSLSMLATALNMAKAPLPQMVLEYVGDGELSDDEVLELLDAWELARQERSTAFADKVKATPVGFSAKELQLVESREHNALEGARSLALPAWAVEASNGASLQYSTVRDNRRELVEAVRLWTAPFEQALSLHAAPRGQDPRFDVTSYVRDDPQTRMNTWAVALASGILTLDEVRAAEPLATGSLP